MVDVPGPVGPEDLVGRWRWRRQVTDRLAGQELYAEGTFELRPSGPDRLTWAETGVLTRPDGSRTDVHRTLGVERRPDGWWLTFADGRDFHPWRPGTEVVHPCGADTYRGTVTAPAPAPGEWQVVWTVSGPAKDYTMTTVLSGWVALSEPSRKVLP